METVISRDTDVVREYLAALDAQARSLSPFQRLVAIVKLGRLRRELRNTSLQTTDDDLMTLKREVDHRLSRTLIRRLIAGPWGSRISIILLIVVVQQAALGLVLLSTMLFVRFAPVPKLWNPLLPHEQPPFLFAFIFLFLLATPLLALLILFGGRFFRAWRTTLPASILIVLVSALGTFFIVRNKERSNPVRHTSSIGQFLKDREVSQPGYDEWLQTNWLMNDSKFKRDYERYLRNGPGRWITSKFDSNNDAAWSSTLPILAEYVDSGQDPAGFRDWLRYYFDRNRIYSESRIDQEVSNLTGYADERFLGIWQVEPYLKERDERLYRAYLGSVERSMRLWALVWLGIVSFCFLLAYVVTFVAPGFRRRLKRSKADTLEDENRRALDLDRSFFPERSEIISTPVYDEPFRLLSHVHYGFVRLVLLTSVAVFAFWILVYAFALSRNSVNPDTQVSLMQRNLLCLGSSDRQSEAGNEISAGRLSSMGDRSSTALAGRVRDLEAERDEADYLSNRRFKEQYRIIASQRNEISLLRSATGQLEQTLPGQLSDIGSRVGVAEARTGEVMGQAEAARQTAEGLQKQLGAKLSEVETRAARAADQIGKVEEQASVLATRTETLEHELDRRARQIEARTEELGERTAGLKEREERVDRLQRVAFTAIFAEIKSDVDGLERRIGSSFYRFFSKGEAHRDADAIRQRISSLTAELREINNDQSKKFIEQLDELTKRLDQIVTRIK